MKAIVLETPGKLLVTDTERPLPPPGEAMVSVQRIGICGTDLHAFKGEQPFFTYPRILGHELGVEIAAIPKNDLGLEAGDRCAIEPYLTCGRCVACRRGRTNCCVSLQTLGVHTDGGMREFFSVPIAKLHRSKILSLDQLALIEPLCIGAHAVERGQLAEGEFVLVIGAGPIGLSVIQFAQVAKARVLVMDLSEERLEFCRRQFHPEFVISNKDDRLAQLKAITSGDMPVAVFDATGSKRSMEEAFQYVAHGGRLIFVGLFQGDVTFHDPDAHRRELTLLCSRNSTAANFAHVISLMEQGRIDIHPWITHRARLTEVPGHFHHWLDPQSRFIKAVVET